MPLGRHLWLRGTSKIGMTSPLVINSTYLKITAFLVEIEALTMPNPISFKALITRDILCSFPIEGG